jgi:hypothetical protein
MYNYSTLFGRQKVGVMHRVSLTGLPYRLTYYRNYASNRTRYILVLFTLVPLAEPQRTIGGLLMSRETALENPASLGQIKEIAATLIQAIPARLSSDDAQRIIEDKGWLVSEVQKLFALMRVQEHFNVDVYLRKTREHLMISNNAYGTALQIEEWSQFYREVFDLNVHYSEVRIPPRRSGFYRMIVVAQGLTLKRIIEAAQRDLPVDLGESRRYFSTDEETRGTHDRLPTQTYAVWVRDQVDPDEAYSNVRPPVLERRGVPCITVLEHLLFHLKYFRETSRFLDRNERQTVCVGSRDANGALVAVFVKKSRRDGKCLGLGLGLNSGPYSSREVIA